MEENRIGTNEPDIGAQAVQYLQDFAFTLGELEVSFRDVEESKELIMGALQAAGHFYEADRVYVLEMDNDLHVGVNTYEWCSDNIPATIIHSQCVPLELIPRLEQYLKMNKPLIIKKAEDIKERQSFCGKENKDGSYQFLQRGRPAYLHRRTDFQDSGCEPSQSLRSLRNHD